MSPKVPGPLTNDVSASQTTDGETLLNLHWDAPKKSLGQYTRNILSTIFHSNIFF